MAAEKLAGQKLEAMQSSDRRCRIESLHIESIEHH